MQDHVLNKLKTQHINAWNEKQKRYRAYLDAKEQVKNISDILYFDYRAMYDAWAELEDLKARFGLSVASPKVQRAEAKYIMLIQRHRIVQDHFMAMAAKQKQLKIEYELARTSYEEIREKLSREIKSH